MIKPPSTRLAAVIALVALLVVVFGSLLVQRHLYRIDMVEDCILQLRLYCKT
jgi:hypothetical protein